MGVCISLKPKRLKLESLQDLQVDNSLAHSLPISKIDSRHSTAIIFSFHGIRKDVISLLLTFNRAARAYVIKSNGLPGFLLEKHDNTASRAYEFKMAYSTQLKILTLLEKSYQKVDKKKFSEE